MDYLMIKGRVYFSYSVHKTFDDAEAALESYYANGEICEAERPQIERVRNGQPLGRDVSNGVMP